MWAVIKRHGWMVSASAAILLPLAAQFGSVTRSSAQATAPESKASSCPADNGGISLPKGFCTSIFADKLGHARQLVVTQDGTVYVNTWSGVYYNNDRVPPDGFLVPGGAARQLCPQSGEHDGSLQTGGRGADACRTTERAARRDAAPRARA